MEIGNEIISLFPSYILYNDWKMKHFIQWLEYLSETMENLEN